MLSAIIGQVTSRKQARTDTAPDPYGTDTDSTNSNNTRAVVDSISDSNRSNCEGNIISNMNCVSHSSSSSNLSETDPQPTTLSLAVCAKLPLRDSSLPQYVQSVYIPIILPVPKSSTWCPIRVNVYAEDDVILR